MDNRIIVFEGPDGSGKTTLSTELCCYLNDHNLPCELISLPGKEKGTLGRIVYDIHHDNCSLLREPITPISLQLLHLASHSEVVASRIRPALDKGKIVVLDRFWWSIAAYGHHAGIDKQMLDLILDIEKSIWQDIQPSSVFLLNRCFNNFENENFDNIIYLYYQIAKDDSAHYPIHYIETRLDITTEISNIVSLLKL